MSNFSFYMLLVLLTTLGLLLAWVFNSFNQVQAAKEMARLPCQHRYVQTTYTLSPDGKASGRAFCADCKVPVNIDVVVNGGTPFDAGLGYVYGGPLGRPPEPVEPSAPLEQVMVSRKDLEKMHADLLKAFPPKECWDCKSINPPVCFSCVERARVRGELKFIEDALTGYLRG